MCCQLCNRRQKGSLFPLSNPGRRATRHTHDVVREKPLFIDPAADDPAEYIEFEEEVARAIGNNRRGRTTIAALDLNRIELQKRRRTLLLVLKNLKQDRDLLAKAIADPTTEAGLVEEMAKRLAEIDAVLQAHQLDSAEYASMARCCLANR